MGLTFLEKYLKKVLTYVNLTLIESSLQELIYLTLF